MIDARVSELAPPGAREPLRRLLEGEISPPIALLHLAPEFESPAALLGFLGEALARLGPAPHAPRLAALLAFARAHIEGLATVRQMGSQHARAMDDLAGRGVLAIRDLYDRLAALDPNAAVALYSFGDPAVLDAVSAEIVAHLEGAGVLAPRVRLLEIGCGIGRLLEAFADRCAAVTGIDVSPRMAALASARVARFTNARVGECNGSDLAGFGDHAFDVVLAADSWPHVVMLGPQSVRQLAREVARVLAPGGEFVVLNLSYREDPGADLADIRALASELGFEVVDAGLRPFAVWDAVVWRLRRPLG
jgi:SAM-dependent methyltransferase